MLHKLAKGIVKCRFIIMIAALVLLVPSIIGYMNTRINYDVLTYLPKDIATMKGQDILEDQFGTGAFSMVVVEGMQDKDISQLEKKIEKVDHVKKVIWYDSFMDLSIPKEMLPDDIYNAFNSGDATMMAVIFDETTSADGTMQAIEDIRKIADKQVFISGMSAIVTDTRDLSNKETPLYVLVAVVLSLIVLTLAMDSYLVGFFFLLSIGMAILYNMGTNFVFGEISYITQALAAVLQLGVTMDYSIFLWHSYEENQERFPGDKKRAMAHAISNTFTSVIASSITTIAGFVALCFMSFTLGLDIGLVMSKGVLFGVISCVTILPSMILIFDPVIEKTKHKAIIPDFNGIGDFATKHYKVFLIVFLVILFPALYGYTHYGVYYNLDSSLPESLPSVQANNALNSKFNMGTTEMILVDKNTSDADVRHMSDDIKKVSGVKWVLGLDTVIGPSIPSELISEDQTADLQNENYRLLLVGSEYKVASDEVNSQCTSIDNIIDKYDRGGMLIGEAPCTKDLITITDTDFKNVSIVSDALIFIIILLTFGSGSLPVILVVCIEFAIFINMGIPFYTGTKLPFVASIVIGTIQLGATVDYAILMTTRYKKERSKGADKRTAISIACQTSAKSIFVSGLCFFASTFGVSVISNIDMISSLCLLMARGALISMVTVIFILPSMLMLFDRIIIHTSRGFMSRQDQKEAIKAAIAAKKDNKVIGKEEAEK